MAPRGRKPKTAVIVDDTVGKKETGAGKETGVGTRRSEAEAMELIEKRKIPQEVYHNNFLQVVGEVENVDEMNSNTKFIKKNLEIARLPEIDLRDVEQVDRRIDEYFSIEAKYKNKPTVSGLAMALNGMNRQRLWEIKTGNYGNTRGLTANLPKNVTDSIKKAYSLLEQLWEDYMASGKINPVAGIFLAKNNFGYRDQVEHIVTPNTDSEYDQTTIRERLGLNDSDS